MKVNFGLSSEAVEDLSADLYRFLANTYALYFNTLTSHWNVEDPRFLPLHEMFQEQYEQLAGNADLIAERIRQLGKKVPGSLKAFAEGADLPVIDENAGADVMISALAEGHEKAILDLRTLSQKSDQYGDYGLTDLLGGLLRDHEKTAWVLRSHL